MSWLSKILIPIGTIGLAINFGLGFIDTYSNGSIKAPTGMFAYPLIEWIPLIMLIAGLILWRMDKKKTSNPITNRHTRTFAYSIIIGVIVIAAVAYFMSAHGFWTSTVQQDSPLADSSNPSVASDIVVQHSTVRKPLLVKEVILTPNSQRTITLDLDKSAPSVSPKGQIRLLEGKSVQIHIDSVPPPQIPFGDIFSILPTIDEQTTLDLDKYDLSKFPTNKPLGIVLQNFGNTQAVLDFNMYGDYNLENTVNVSPSNPITTTSIEPVIYSVPIVNYTLTLSPGAVKEVTYTMDDVRHVNATGGIIKGELQLIPSSQYKDATVYFYIKDAANGSTGYPLDISKSKPLASNEHALGYSIIQTGHVIELYMQNMSKTDTVSIHASFNAVYAGKAPVTRSIN